VPLTEEPPRILDDREKTILGFLYGGPQHTGRIATALMMGKEQVRQMLEPLIQEGFVRKYERSDKPYFGTTQFGREAAI
jgi:DNA-binding IclR family transcriptional regulator